MICAAHTPSLCSLVAAALLTAVATPARGQTLRWLAPDRAALGPFQVGLVAIDEAGRAQESPKAIATIAGGVLEETAGRPPVRLFVLHPKGGQVRLEARDGSVSASATIEIGPPAVRLELKATPAAPVKNQATQTRLEITVLGADGKAAAEASTPVARTNVGVIDDLKPIGAGRFEAIYHLPQENYPEVAIVVAFAPWPHADAIDGAFGALAIPLSSAVVLPGRSEPMASATVEIAKRIFGPVVADEKGVFAVPVVVPPGHRFATHTATDRLGNRRAKQLDLHLPPTDQIACVANPTSLPADGVSRARIVCMATDPFGAPVANAKILARAKLGKLEGPHLRADAYEWEYVAPDRALQESDELSFDYPAGGPQSKERVALRFRPLALATARVGIAPQPVFQGATAKVTLVASDRHGQPVVARASLKARRGVLSEFEGSSARYTPPPESMDWSETISGTILGALGTVPARLRIGSDAGQLLVRAEGIAGEPIPELALELGTLKAKTDTDGVASFTMSDLPADATLSVHVADRSSVASRIWRLRTAEGERFFPDEGAFKPFPLSVSVALAPSTPVDLQLTVEPGALRARVLDVTGLVLPGRKLSWSVLRAGTPVAAGVAREDADGSVVLPLLERGSGTVSASVADVESGVTAAEEVVLP